MGAWGSGSFENDDAADWVAGLATITPDDLTRIFTRAADDPSYLEAPDASIAVAAAEVIAALHGAPAKNVPAKIVEWTESHTDASTPELKALATRAVERVRRDSEVKDLWLEADGIKDWIEEIQDLQTRLAG
jgi:hypothetical protein